jgi:OmpA-OmpF porin, OOP family
MKLFIRLLFLVTILSIANNVHAQKIDIKGKLKNQINNRANQHVDNAIDKSLDAVEDGAKNSVKNDSEADNSTEKKDDAVQKEQKEETAETSATQNKVQSTQEKVAVESHTKYDFIPGDKILYFEDFSQDAIGDFPALWNTNGTGEVKTINIAPGNWLHLNGDGCCYLYNNDLTFPANFIIEFDIIPDSEYGNSGLEMTLFGEDKHREMNDELYPGNGGLHISLGTDVWETKGYDADTETDDLIGSSKTATVEKETVNHVIIWVQNRRVRIYHKGVKALDVPVNIISGTTFKRLRFSNWGREVKPYISNIKITTAAPDTRSKLITEGKLISYGIYFDVNKDIVKPESNGALNDIAKVLNENPTVKVRITGFTDSDGDDAANLDLSKRRAASVKNELAKTFKIDASRIETDGKGENNSIAPNDTPSNKAMNRRVEFTKL